MNKKESLEKIKKLVERYEKLSEEEKRKYNEQQTKDHFIRPLFEALGWDFTQDVWPETDVSGKRVDYSFKIEGLTKFFIEAKQLSVNLEEERFAEQAINYSWHKSVPWVILTDFKAIKVYNTEWDEPNIQSCQYFKIPYDKYLTDERLWLLSRDAFKEGLLDKKATEEGRKPEKTIDKFLAEDLVMWRDSLYKNLCAYNTKIDKNKISQYVQKILNRLIFIRTLEDRGIEDIILQPLVREWEERGKSNELLSEINKLFRKIDKDYDSGLFEEDITNYLGDKIDAEDGVFVDIINELYRTKKRGIRYNFADIPADIFGGIYEQYLGHIQKENGGDKKKGKRKSQGIYYTPRYIVDYIVQNTLGEVLKNKKPNEIKDIKILDPACGSGSFLIQAYQTLIDYRQEIESKNFKFKEKGDQLKKLEQLFKKRKGKILSQEEKQRILLNNIHGVDLDEDAVELAKLNLLLKMVERRLKLPKLHSNIQVGNSLISGSETELKKYFGKNWKEKKPFNWEEKFKDVFDEGGFDIVVGNPPYVNLANIKDSNIREYLKINFETAKNKSDLYSFFVERAIKLLKEGGHLGFIISNSWLGTDSFSKFRKYLIENTIVYKMVKLPPGVFEEATVIAVLIFLKKSIADKKHAIKLFEFENGKFEKLNYELGYERIKNSPSYNFSFSPELSFKISTIKLGDIAKFSLGIKTSNDKKFILNKRENKDCYKLLRGKDTNRYNYNWAGKWIWYRPDLMMEKIGAGPRKLKYFQTEKIFIKDVAQLILATYDKQNYLSNDTLSIIYHLEKYNFKFILCLLNSKLVNKWFGTNFEAGLHIKINQLEQVPIPKIDFSNKKEKAKHDELVKLADKMLKLNKELQKLDLIMDKEECEEKKKEIEKTDKEIDEKVYKLYGLTKEEVKTVKKSLQK